MCEHERLRTVGDRVFCCACGEELPLTFLEAKNIPADAPAEDKSGKSTTRKKTPKPPVKTP